MMQPLVREVGRTSSLRPLKAWFAAAAMIAGAAGCSRHPNDHSAATEQAQVARAPHGGRVTDAGDDYRIEFVRDSAAGTLTAYILDDDLEEFIRIQDRSLELDLGPTRKLTLNAAASSATGETVGNTSQFDGQADWLKTTGALHGVLKAITIRGSTFRDLPVSLPATHDQS